MAIPETAIKWAFDTIDTDKSKSIDVKEIKEGIKLLMPGLELQDADINKIMKKIDTNDDKKLDYNEFVKFFRAHEEEEMKKAFAAFDKDGSGFITEKELAAAVKNMGGSAKPAEIKKMIKDADTSGDGKVSYEEFKRMMGH